jgi:hypothetical protein
MYDSATKLIFYIKQIIVYNYTNIQKLDLIISEDYKAIPLSENYFAIA